MSHENHGTAKDFSTTQYLRIASETSSCLRVSDFVLKFRQNPSCATSLVSMPSAGLFSQGTSINRTLLDPVDLLMNTAGQFDNPQFGRRAIRAGIDKKTVSIIILAPDFVKNRHQHLLRTAFRHERPHAAQPQTRSGNNFHGCRQTYFIVCHGPGVYN